MNIHDQQALEYYNALIAMFYPPALAIALVQVRYQGWVAEKPILELPMLKEALKDVQAIHPDLKRDAGRTIAAIDRRETISGANSRKR